MYRSKKLNGSETTLENNANKSHEGFYCGFLVLRLCGYELLLLSLNRLRRRRGVALALLADGGK